MNFRCPIGIHCGDYPFANLSSEGLEVPWLPPTTGNYWTGVGYCCDTTLKEAWSGVSQDDADLAVNRILDTACPTCSDSQKFCADADCPDGTNLTEICVPTSQADADALAAAAANAMLPFCDSKEDLYQSTCSCPDGSDPHTTHSNISDAVAQAECDVIVKNCNDGGSSDTTGGDNSNPQNNPTHGVCNTAQTCTETIDGTVSSYTVPAGTICKMTLAEANAFAMSLACALLHEGAARITALPAFCCLLQSFNSTLTLTGVVGVVTWELIGTLPPGLVFSQSGNYTGLISGTPTTAGTYSFGVRVTIGANYYATRTFSLIVFGFVTDSDLPDGTVGVDYSQQIVADGGSGNYLFTITDGALPDGLGLGPTGFITGTPTTEETGLFTVTVHDLVTTTMTCSLEYQLEVIALGSHTIISVFRAGPLSVYVGAVEVWTDTPKVFPALGFVWVKQGVTVCSGHALSGDGDYGPMLTCGPTGLIHGEFDSSNPAVLPSSQSAEIDAASAVSPAATVQYDAASIAVIQAILPAFIGTANLSYFGSAPIWMELYGGGSVTLWYGTVIIIQVGVNSWWFKRHDNTYSPAGVFYFEYGTIPIALTQITIS